MLLSLLLTARVQLHSARNSSSYTNQYSVVAVAIIIYRYRGAPEYRPGVFFSFHLSLLYFRRSFLFHDISVTYYVRNSPVVDRVSRDTIDFSRPTIASSHRRHDAYRSRRVYTYRKNTFNGQIIITIIITRLRVVHVCDACKCRRNSFLYNV